MLLSSLSKFSSFSFQGLQEQFFRLSRLMMLLEICFPSFRGEKRIIDVQDHLEVIDLEKEPSILQK